MTGPLPAILLKPTIEVHVIFVVATTTVFAVLVARVRLLRRCDPLELTSKRLICIPLAHQSSACHILVDVKQRKPPRGCLRARATWLEFDTSSNRSSPVTFHHFFKNLSCMYKWYLPSSRKRAGAAASGGSFHTPWPLT